jgi:hypothetical protein
MSWEPSTVKQVKIMIVGPHVPGAKHVGPSITFGVNGDQKVMFNNILLDYIKSVEELGGIIHEVEEVADATTNEVQDLLLTVVSINNGPHQELQQRMEAFRGASTWQK